MKQIIYVASSIFDRDLARRAMNIVNKQHINALDWDREVNRCTELTPQEFYSNCKRSFERLEGIDALIFVSRGIHDSFGAGVEIGFSLARHLPTYVVTEYGEFKHFFLSFDGVKIVNTVQDAIDDIEKYYSTKMRVRL